MCVFCTGTFARLVARFDAQPAETPPVGEISAPRLRTDGVAAAPGSLPNGAERRNSDNPSVNPQDLLSMNKQP
jgi:hypothetical protein